MKENCDKIIYENGEYFFEEMYNIKSDRIELVSIYYNRESCNRYRNEKGEEIAFFNLIISSCISCSSIDLFLSFFDLDKSVICLYKTKDCISDKKLFIRYHSLNFYIHLFQNL